MDVIIQGKIFHQNDNEISLKAFWQDIIVFVLSVSSLFFTGMIDFSNVVKKSVVCGQIESWH